MNEMIHIAPSVAHTPPAVLSHTTLVVATIIFALAILHTFSVGFFAKLASKPGPHSGLWHFFSEVEAVFGIWATILLVYIAFAHSGSDAVNYVQGRNFTEPFFVFVIMIVAASKPILVFITRIVNFCAKLLPVPALIARFFVLMFLVPLAGSFITEPAAMTLAALMLKDCFFSRDLPVKFKYIAIGGLFVNISIGGVLTNFAAPPVLMVAHAFDWSTLHMMEHYGWKAISTIFINALMITLLVSKALAKSEADKHVPLKGDSPNMPWIVILIHLAFLVAVVMTSHDATVFVGLLLLFIGYTQAYSRFQNPLMIKEALMVAFFLAGLILLGELQHWWLQPALQSLDPILLYFGSTGLTAITDNAALTFLGSLVDVTQHAELWRYMLVAGAVTGGGLTVIANAPNPAGFSILKECFPNESVSPKGLFIGALVPTLIAMFFFLVPRLLWGI